MDDVNSKVQEILRLDKIPDIVPHIIEHVKTLTLGFTSEYGVGGWELCEDTWFPSYVAEAVDFDAAMEANVITYVEPTAFNARYWSDEIHRYKVLWFEGEFVAINFKVGDTSSSHTLWFKEGERVRIMCKLMSMFPKTDEDSVDACELYTPETGSQITSSQYIEYFSDGNGIWRKTSSRTTEVLSAHAGCS